MSRGNICVNKGYLNGYRPAGKTKTSDYLLQNSKSKPTEICCHKRHLYRNIILYNSPLRSDYIIFNSTICNNYKINGSCNRRPRPLNSNKFNNLSVSNIGYWCLLNVNNATLHCVNSNVGGNVIPYNC